MVSSLVSIFRQPSTCYTIKTNCIKLYTNNPSPNYNFLEKGLERVFPSHLPQFGTSLPESFSTWFLKKSISLVICYLLTKFQCLDVFTSWGIGLHVYCDCLLTSFWLLNFEINLIFLIKSFFLHKQKVKTKI